MIAKTHKFGRRLKPVYKPISELKPARIIDCHPIYLKKNKNTTDYKKKIFLQFSQVQEIIRARTTFDHGLIRAVGKNCACQN